MNDDPIVKGADISTAAIGCVCILGAVVVLVTGALL